MKDKKNNFIISSFLMIGAEQTKMRRVYLEGKQFGVV